MSEDRNTLEQLYQAFNLREIDAALALMADTVSWPKASEGGRVTGRDEIRAYWTRQWAEFDPHVEPVAIELRRDGRFDVKVHQTVRDLAGTILSDLTVIHTFTLVDGRVERMDLDESVSAFGKHELKPA